MVQSAFMRSIHTLIQKITPKHPLYIRILFTALSFLVMVVLSYLFMRSVVQRHLIQNTQNVLASVQSHIVTDLLEPRVTLGGFSQTVRNMIINDGTGSLQLYINDLSSYRNLTSGQTLSTINGIYGWFETLPDGPAFLNGIGWTPPDDYDATERVWYQAAIDARGEIVETPPYKDSITGEIVFSYARALFDDNGRRLGAVALDILLSDIGNYVVDTALARGGYGILLSKDLVVLAHPNHDFVGKRLRDIGTQISSYEAELRNGVEISERSVISYKNEASVAFFRQLPNGWFLCVMTPKGPYYESIVNMALILGILGAALAITLILVLLRIDMARIKSDIENKHKSAFLANMSHEIRTPMNAIIGMTTIGKSAAGLDRKDYCFSKIEDASNHLLGVINNILDMSKIEANKFELAPVDFHLEKMLQRVVNVVSFRIDEKKQKFKVRINKDIPKVLVGDDQRLAQVVTNLLGNAIKFTPEYGTITLEVHYVKEENGIFTIKISISDSGIGINSEQQGRLFTSFEQAESSTTRKFGGTGLGLSISKNIVQLMGGEIWVESEPEKGATFSFTIQAQRGTSKEQDLSAQNINWGNVRIMAIDDDPDILSYFKEISQSFGIYCDTAISGENALKLVEENGAHHLYFVDWKMPGMDGVQITAELKTRVPANAIVIMISAAEWGAIAEEAKKAGVDKFLPKPLFPSAIADIISESLNLRQRETEKETADITGLFAGRHILLADDVEINREIVMTLLEPALLTVDCAENGAIAASMFEKNPEKYDMIFMDVQMPEMDGYDATRKIRSLHAKNAKTIPIIAMTANVFREDIEKCLQAGMNEHVGKPISFNEVIAILKKYLGSR